MEAVIYCITNKINGKKYIGQSWNFYNRKKAHISKAKHGEKSHLYDAIRKYGKESFVWEIVEWIDCDENAQLVLDEKESLWIDHYDTQNPDHGYNVRDGGSRGKHSLQTKEKLSKLRQGVSYGPIHSEEWKKQLSENAKKNPLFSSKGRILSDETKKKISESNTGKKHGDSTGRILSESTRNKISASLTGRKASDDTKRKKSEAMKENWKNQDRQKRSESFRKGWEKRKGKKEVKNE